MMKRKLILCVLFTSCELTFTGTANATYIRPQIENVPVETLAQNLAAMAKKKPKDVNVRLNLARLHAMAYALKSDTAQVLTGKENNGAWFGFEPKYVPFQTKATDDPAALKAAQSHLKLAIEDYRQAITLDKKNLTAQLGLGWCLKEAGKTEEAVAQLRKTVKAGWDQESKLRAGRLGGHYITVEAAEYLIPLLDEQQDAVEIAELKDRSAELSRLPRPVTPIAIPLSGNLQPVDMVNHKAKVAFDADGTGRVQNWTWIHNNSGWLVYDRSGTGRVTSAIQMFGSVTFWLYWDNGYQALTGLDINADGELAGKELKHLAIWHDENENGVSEPGEVRSLAHYGIVAVNCIGQTSAEDGVTASSAQGVRFADGSTRATYDLLLEAVR